MAFNPIALVGIIVFYVIIIAIGALLAYRMIWFKTAWQKIQQFFGCKVSANFDEQTNNNNNNKETPANNSTTNDNNDLMLANRSLGLFVGTFTLTAGWVGGGFISGTAEQVYTEGVLYTQAPWAYALSLLFGGLLFAKILRDSNCITFLDPFQRKFGLYIGGLTLIPAFIAEIFWSLTLLTSLSYTLSVVLDFNSNYCLMIAVAVAVLFNITGGLKLLAYVDVIQFAIMVIVLWVSIPMLLTNKAVGSISGQFGRWSGTANYEPVSLWLWFDNTLLLIFGGIPWQTFFQKILACKSTKVAYLLSFTSAALCLTMAVPPVLIGAVGSTTDWSAFNLTASHAELVDGVMRPTNIYMLSLVFVKLLPPAMMFIMVGAFAASSLSCTDSSMLGASTMMSHNIYKMVLRPRASNKELMWVFRAVTVLIGLVAIGLSYLSIPVYVLWFLSSDLVYVILFPRLVTVTYFKYSTSYGSVLGSLFSAIFRFLFGEPALGIKPLLAFPPYNSKGDSCFPFRTVAMLGGLAVDMLVSYATHYLFVIKKVDKKYDVLRMLSASHYKELKITPKNSEDEMEMRSLREV